MDARTRSDADRLLKLRDVIGDKKRGIEGRIPMSHTKWYAGIKNGVFPPPVRIGCGSFWRLSDIQKLIDQAA